ncbi:LysR family transcriptional regulator [Iocasia frigidifontis]|uniref:LysR family transcriptional regulator n=1 Tax=Iocasia fonsfrigidae TaxID=2682810 RepID=A0A8A7KF33_9FIRM|nr:LysR family transcriptional regulator [Iocasia fonsfrigidae]
MSLRQLRIFIFVCKTGSMTKTAEELYMTQPAVSQTILDLEDSLNVRLFDRIKNSLVLTNTGEILLEYSQKIIHLMEETEDVIDRIVNIKQGGLRIGASMTIGTYLLPEILNGFRERFSGVDLPLIVDNTVLIVNKILNNELDLALVEGPINSPDIIVEPYCEDSLSLVCSVEHHWSQRDYIDPAEIEGEKLIIREEGSGTRDLIQNTFLQHNVLYNIAHTINNFEAIKKAVSANIGISLIPAIGIKKEIKKGELKEIRLEDISFKRLFKLIYHKDKYLTGLFKEFYDYIYEYKDKKL